MSLLMGSTLCGCHTKLKIIVFISLFNFGDMCGRIFRVNQIWDINMLFVIRILPVRVNCCVFHQFVCGFMLLIILL